MGYGERKKRRIRPALDAVGVSLKDSGTGNIVGREARLFSPSSSRGLNFIRDDITFLAYVGSSGGLAGTGSRNRVDETCAETPRRWEHVSPISIDNFLVGDHRVLPAWQAGPD
jgi:hypothetical protein